MTDEQLDHLIRDADPYRAIGLGHLDGARQSLLEEIMSEPPQPRFALRHRLARRSAVVVAAAAVLVALLPMAFVAGGRGWHEENGSNVATVEETAATPGPIDAAAAKEAAEKMPRLLVREDGWTIVHVYGFRDGDGSGDISFQKGTLLLDMNWYRAESYDSYYQDRLQVSAPEAGGIVGWTGKVFTYSDNDFAIMLTPRDDVFVELRLQGAGVTRAVFDEILTHVEQVDVDTWLAAMPADVITPDRISAKADELLADIPLPPGFDKSDLDGAGTNDAYQFGAAVTGLVGCEWIAEWTRADRAGDDAARKRAAEALTSSHQWKVLNDMNAEGDWPEVFWELADKVADGDVPSTYKDWIGCK
ncbi:hypothetical protein [Actinoplanes sp. NPDC051851]|uniref:hypothetical protein n=1 Tax=Actinoplanes sp. NPDC051851 TaxID=3154753 RepID=UPI003419C9AC